MSADRWALFLMWLALVPANLFPALYMVSAPWHRSWAGRAIVTSKIGLAGLVDGSLLFRLLGTDYPGHDALVLTSFGLIVVGTYLYLVAFALEQYVKRHH